MWRGGPQLADRLVEVYNGSSKRRLDMISECFAPGVKLLNLKTRTVVLEGADKLRDSMPSDYAKWAAECGKRLFVSRKGGGSGDVDAATFCLDLYEAGHAPGINAFGE
jgi:hypothetical protein